MLAGVSFKIISAFLFTVMAAIIGYLGGQVSIGELVFARNFFALLPILIWLGLRQEIGEAFGSRAVFGHMLRSFAGCAAMFCNFLALGLLPLANATVIGFASPLITVILAAILLKESVRLYRWGAVFIGLIGVTVIVAPNLATPDALEPAAFWGSLLALAGACFTAVAMIQVRRLTQTETTGAIVLYFSIFSSLIGASTIPFGWEWPQGNTLWFLIAIGVLGGVGQIFLTQSYRLAAASLIAPFEYVALLWAIIIGWVAFGHLPDFYVIIGGLIVISSGIFVIWRERKLGIERAKVRKVQPASHP